MSRIKQDVAAHVCTPNVAEEEGDRDNRVAGAFRPPASRKNPHVPIRIWTGLGFKGLRWRSVGNGMLLWPPHEHTVVRGRERLIFLRFLMAALRASADDSLRVRHGRCRPGCVRRGTVSITKASAARLLFVTCKITKNKSTYHLLLDGLVDWKWSNFS